MFFFVLSSESTFSRSEKVVQIERKTKFFPHFFILLPPTQGDKRGSRTKKRKHALTSVFHFILLKKWII